MAPRGGAYEGRGQCHIHTSPSMSHLTLKNYYRESPNRVQMAPCLPELGMMLLDAKVSRLLPCKEPQDWESTGATCTLW